MDDSPSIDPGLTAKREQDRLRKQSWRLRQSRQAEARDPSQAGRRRGPSPPPAEIASRRFLGPLLGPMGPGEARRQLYRATQGLSKVIGSRADWEEHEFQEAGDAYADLANHLWPLRIVVRFLAPLVLIGALVGITAKMLAETRWWQERRARKDAERVAREGGALVVEKDLPPATPAPPSARRGWTGIGRRLGHGR